MDGLIKSSLDEELRNPVKVSHLQLPRSRMKNIPPPLVLLDDVSNDLLTEFAIIATSPRSPLMQKNLPIRKRVYTCSSLDNIHSYARQPLTPPPGILSPPSSMEEIPSSPGVVDGFVNRRSDCDGAAGWLSHRWPIAAWQCFLKGARVLVLDGGVSSSASAWQTAEELGRKAEKSYEILQYAPNGLRLVDSFQCLEDRTFPTMLDLRFSPVHAVPFPQPDIRVEFNSDHPFFVKDKGWSSAAPNLTVRTYGIPCHRLQTNDVCLPPTHPDASLTSDIYDSIKRHSYDFTPEDTSAALALSAMAMKQVQSLALPPSTISPPSSPVKKRGVGHAMNGTAVLAADAKPCKRPMNGFMLFAKKYRIEYTQLYPGNDNRAISVLLGDRWNSMSAEERGQYAEQARILAEQQKKLYPDCWKRRRSSSTS